MSTHQFSLSVACRVGVCAIALLAGSSALAQWQWVDSSGKKVFSDTAPPPGTPDKNILKRPGARIETNAADPKAAEATGGAAPAAPTAAAAPAAAPKVTGKDQELEAKKKQAEKQAAEAEQAKRKAEADKFAKTRADNCDRAKRAKQTMDSGVRIATTNAKGEREIMDEKARAAESRRIDEVVRADCGPVAPSASGSSSTVQ